MRPSSPQDKGPHIVVVGAGILGSAIAFHLSARGAQVTVVDAGEPGRGASAVSFAWINGRDKNPRHYHDLNRRSLDMWDRFARQLGGDVGLTWGGELCWAATPAGAEELIERVKTLQSWGYPTRLLDAAELKRLEPGLSTGPVTTASYTPIDGHVDPGKVIRACLARAAERGVTVRSGTKVTGLHLARSASGPPRIEAVEVEGGKIPCDIVVLAGGADTPALAAHAGLEIPLYHTFGATIITEVIAPVFRQVAVVHTPRDLEPQTNFRQLPDGAFMLHGGSHGGPHDGSLGRTEAEIEQVFAAVKRFVPALEKTKIKEVRRGRRPLPQDGLPILGFARAVPNLYLAAMHSGVTLAALVGEFAALEIIDGARIDLLEPYRLERFD
jgi:glycine/D-amino acid oxidase-like deaminating enzyme